MRAEVEVEAVQTREEIAQVTEAKLCDLIRVRVRVRVRVRARVRVVRVRVVRVRVNRRGRRGCQRV